MFLSTRKIINYIKNFFHDSLDNNFLLICGAKRGGCMRSVKNVIYFLLTVFFLLLLPLVFAPEEYILPLQGTAKVNDAKMTSGNLIVEIYDAPTSGNLVYNSTNDFLNVISNGAYDILLGNGTQPLSLNYSTKYYMDMYINDVDVDFNGSERQVFMSTVGNLSVTTPIKTTSNDADDALNVSAGGFFLGGNAVFNNLFNISGGTGNTVTSGRLQIESSDIDDALNLTSGGLKISSASETAFIINNWFNVSGSNGATTISGPLKIVNTDTNDALNLSRGSLNINTNNSNSQLGIYINSGGADLCGFIALADVNGTFRYLFFNTSGILRIMNSTPSGVGDCERGGTPAGSQ